MNKNHQQVLAFLSSQETKLNYIYSEFSRNLAKLLRKYNVNSSSRVWHRNLGLQKEVDALFKQFQPQLLNHFSKQVTEAWEMADKHNDVFVSSYLGKTAITDAQKTLMFGRNQKALEAFLTTKQGKLTLSERVWDITSQTKDQIEYFLKEGLTEGRSATKLAGDLKSYLKNPKVRFRRIKDKKTGKLKLSEPAKDYHPGRGVYRSSYQNSLRLARNEVNIAYRTADNIRREKLPFVVGVEVHLSNRHPSYDICDEMVGKYPKGFVFTGFHVNCLCYSTNVLLSKNDFKKYQRGDLNPTEKGVKTIPKKASNYIKKLPNEKVAKLQFVDENKEYFKEKQK